MRNYILVKRIFDLYLCIAILPVLLIPFAVIAVLIKFDSKGPVFFVQKRLGQFGKVFKIYKFRTMVEGAINMEGGLHTYDRDPRITRVGAFLRKTSIDEIPQIINILKGEMSIIGPRPPVPYYPRYYEEYDENQKKRFVIKPGITGYAQVKVRNSATWDERILLDLEYIEKMSFWTDLYIFFKTISRVMKMDNVYF